MYLLRRLGPGDYVVWYRPDAPREDRRELPAPFRDFVHIALHPDGTPPAPGPAPRGE